MSYAISTKLDSEAAYPYEAVQRGCRAKPGDVNIAGVGYVTASCSDCLAGACNAQPVSVLIEADQYVF
jgi:hypothetical protein